MNWWSEFKSFAVKGDVMNLAIGIVIGGAFGKITTSLVNDILMPAVGYMIGNFDISKLVLKLEVPADIASKYVIKSGPIIIAYGQFLQTIFNFLIIAIAMFVLVKGLNNLKKKQEDPKDTSVPTPKDIELLSEIRDLLRKEA